LNFGLPGGMGAKGIVKYAKAQYGVIFTEAEAKGHIEKWKSLWPEQDKYFRFIRNCVGPAQSGAIVQLRSWRRRGGCGFTDGSNTLFQGLAADLAKEAGYEVSKACYLDTSSPLYGSRIVNFIHDEIILEIPEDRMHEAALESQRIMEAVGRKWCPNVPPKAEPALMRRWYKGAEPTFANGRLIPWEPKAA